MINEIARMQFQSARNPSEKGALVLTDDGFFSVEPSEEFVDEMIRLEEKAVGGASKRGYLVGGLLMAAGVAVAALTWMAARLAGEMRETLTRPRPAEEVTLATDGQGSVQVIIPGAGVQKVQMTWEPGETNMEEAARFLAIHQELTEEVTRNRG